MQQYNSNKIPENILEATNKLITAKSKYDNGLLQRRQTRLFNYLHLQNNPDPLNQARSQHNNNINYINTQNSQIPQANVLGGILKNSHLNTVNNSNGVLQQTSSQNISNNKQSDKGLILPTQTHSNATLQNNNYTQQYHSGNEQVGIGYIGQHLTQNNYSSNYQIQTKSDQLLNSRITRENINDQTAFDNDISMLSVDENRGMLGSRSRGSENNNFNFNTGIDPFNKNYYDQQQEQQINAKNRHSIIDVETNNHVLDIEEVNRNKRILRDYFKDQIKEQRRLTSSKLLVINKFKKGLFSKQDSLTKAIQQQSAAAIRRSSVKNLTALLQGNEIPISPTKKVHKSMKKFFQQKISKNQRDQKLNISNIWNQSQKPSQKIEDENSYLDSNFTSQSSKIKHKKTMFQNAIDFMIQPKEEQAEDGINESQIRMINRRSQNSCMILYPDSNMRSLVDATSFALMIIISIYIPVVLAFNVDTSGSFDYFELFIDVWFLTEILFNFITGYYHKGILILERSKIIWSYLMSWFFIDLFSSLPILIIFIISKDDAGNYQAVRSAKLLRIVRFARYARLIRLIKFLRLNKYLQPFEELIVTDYAHLGVRFLKITCAVVFIAHWAACVIYMIGVNDFNDQGTNWLTLQNLNDSSIFEQYINSLYWTITTMCTVGYGDFHPVTSNERVISMVIMIISSGVFAFIIGDISRMVSSFNFLADQFREKMIYVDKFLKQKYIPLNIRVQVKRYLEYNLQLKKHYKIEERDVLGLLNEDLRTKLKVYFNGKILQNIDVLKKFPMEFLSNLSFILRKEIYIVDDNLIIEKENGDEMFFMQTGRVAVIHKKSKTHIAELEMEKYFGEIGFFTDLPRQSTIKARDFTEVLILKRDDFLIMARNIQSDASLALFLRIRQSVAENSKDMKLLMIKCYICNVIGHIAINCKQFHRLKGNLKRYLKKRYNTDHYQTEEGFDNQMPQIKIVENPLLVSLESQENRNRKVSKKARKIKPPRKRMSIKKLQVRRNVSPKRTRTDIRDLDPVSKISNTNLVINLHFNDCVSSFIQSENQTSVGDPQQNNFFEDVPQIHLNSGNIQSQKSLSDSDQSRLSVTFANLQNLNQYHKELSQVSSAPKLVENDFDGNLIPNMVHFDTPRKEQTNPKLLKRIQTKTKNQLKRKRSVKSKLREEVIQEDLLEDYQSSNNNENSVSSKESSSQSLRNHSRFQLNLSERMNDNFINQQNLCKEIQDTLSHDSQEEIQNSNNEEEKQPLIFKQKTIKSRAELITDDINQLSKIVGQRKRFDSIEREETQAQNLSRRQSTFKLKRKIFIKPMVEISRKVSRGDANNLHKFNESLGSDLMQTNNSRFYENYNQSTPQRREKKVFEDKYSELIQSSIVSQNIDKTKSKKKLKEHLIQNSFKSAYSNIKSSYHSFKFDDQNKRKSIIKNQHNPNMIQDSLEGLDQ